MTMTFHFNLVVNYFYTNKEYLRAWLSTSLIFDKLGFIVSLFILSGKAPRFRSVGLPAADSGTLPYCGTNRYLPSCNVFSPASKLPPLAPASTTKTTSLNPMIVKFRFIARLVIHFSCG